VANPKQGCDADGRTRHQIEARSPRIAHHGDQPEADEQAKPPNIVTATAFPNDSPDVSNYSAEYVN
jgi:hypothetical protein